MHSHKEPVSRPERRKRNVDVIYSRSKYYYKRRIKERMNTKESDIKIKVCDFGNLYGAMQDCANGVRWKDSVAGYVKNGLSNCFYLHEELMRGTYTVSKYIIFYIYDPKLRKIVSTRFKDRVFQRSLCDNYLTKQTTRSFIYDNGACQHGKGTTFSRGRLKRHMQKFFRKHGLNGYVYKFDLSNFFGSTRHDIACAAMADRIDDEWALSEIKKIIESFDDGDNPQVGLGLGSQVTQLIQLAVLDDLDHFIKEKLKIKYYIRYMDDFIIIHEDKDYIKYCYTQIKERLSELGLTLNLKKTQLSKLSQPIKFLGFSFRLTDTGKVVMKLLPEKISHERRKLRKLVAKAKDGLLTRREVDACFKSWEAHAKQGDCYNLIQSMKSYYATLWEDEVQ